VVAVAISRVKRLFENAAVASDPLPQLVFGPHVFQHDDEVVAANTGDDVAGFDRFEHGTNLDQYFVTDHVPVRSIDLTKAVEI
jgi:hypothetical protein